MIARAIRHHDFSPQVSGEDKLWRFLGIWAKNNAEWLTTQYACMKARTAVVGFYDA